MGDRFENTAIIETPDLDDYIRLVTKEGGTRRALASELAKKIVEEYEGSSLGGEERTIQAAISDAKQVASEAIQEEQTARQNADTAINTDLAKKAYADGEYADLHAGTANQILSDTYTTDEEPYNYRATPSNAGTREIDEIVGVSVVWNQVAKYLVGTSTSNGITSTVKEDGTRTLQGTATALWSSNSPDSTHPDWANDVIYFCGCPKGGSAETFYTRNGYDARPVNFDTGDGKIVKGHANGFIYQMVVLSGTTIDATFTPQAFNLTKMFANNPAIADHIYNLEQATAGAGVAFFRKYFPEEYYAYDVGTMRSVEGLVSHDTVGFNQWDEEW
ncbi:MAG TPA: hypothetical protein DCG33_04135, partial [Prevotellaceae bacterium]|nr:hypothetical protein [Prevotellaceae bacterium]